MINLSKPNIENQIIYLLSRGPVKTIDLILKIRAKRHQTTKQAVYQTLRNLSRDQIITIHQKSVSLNLRWLMNMSTFFGTAQHYYSTGHLSAGHFANLKDKERVNYSFRDSVAADVFWDHAIYLLLQITNINDDLYAYNPHCWFFIARTSDERALKNYLIKIGRRYLLTVGGQTKLDRLIAKEFNGTSSQYTMLTKPLFPKTNYYLNIIGDYMIEVCLNLKISRDIEKIYANKESVQTAVAKKLEWAVNQKGKTKLTISRNHAKATKIKKTLSRTFYLPIKTGK